MENVTNYLPWVEILYDSKELKPYMQLIGEMFNNICFDISTQYRTFYKYIPYEHKIVCTPSGRFMVEVLFDKQPDHCLKIEDVIVSILQFREEPIVLYNSTQYR